MDRRLATALLTLAFFLKFYSISGLIGTKNTMDMLDFLKKNLGREDVIKRKSKLQYKILRNGTGQFHPLSESTCLVHFVGTTLSKTPDAVTLDEEHWDVVNASKNSGDWLVLSYEIKAFKEALKLMVEGDRWELYIHSDLGYGDKGIGEKILGGDLYIVRMELLRIKGDKVRSGVCDPDTKEGCAQDEIELLEYLGSTPSVDTIKRREELFRAKLDSEVEPLKAAQRYEIKAKLQMLKKLKKKAKARERGKDL